MHRVITRTLSTDLVQKGPRMQLLRTAGQAARFVSVYVRVFQTPELSTFRHKAPI